MTNTCKYLCKILSFKLILAHQLTAVTFYQAGGLGRSQQNLDEEFKKINKMMVEFKPFLIMEAR